MKNKIAKENNATIQEKDDWNQSIIGIDKTNKVSFEVISEKMNLSAPTPLGDLSAHIRSFRGNISLCIF